MTTHTARKGHTPEAIAKQIATRTGQPLEVVEKELAAERAWCWQCRSWHPRADFYRRSDGGLAAHIPCHQKAMRERSAPTERRTCASCFTEKQLAEFGRDRTKRDGIARRCLACGTLKTKLNTERREKAKAARTNTVRSSTGSGGQRCSIGDCAAAGTFVLATGKRACARCLKARVKERKSAQQRSENA
jgi:hypothetical protein